MVNVDSQYRIVIPTELAKHLNFKLGETVYVYIINTSESANPEFEVVLSQVIKKNFNLAAIRKFEEKKFRFAIGKDVCKIFENNPKDCCFIPYVKDDLLHLKKK